MAARKRQRNRFSGAGRSAMNLQYSIKTCSKLLLLGSSLLFVFLSPVYADKEQQQRQQLKQLNKESATLKKLLKQFKSERSQLQVDLQSAETKIGLIQKKTRKTLRKLDKERSELKKLQSERQQLVKEKQNQQQLISQQVVAAYQLGRQKKIKVLLNQEEPEKITRALTYADYFHQARNEEIEGYLNIINKINELEPKIQLRTISLSRIKNQLEQEYASLIDSKQTRKASLTQINTSIRDSDQRLAQTNKDRLELERLLKAVEESLANIEIPVNYQPFSNFKGKLEWPVRGKVSQRFGSPRGDSSLRWQGVKIQANEGSQIQSIHHGRVVFADWFKGSGLLVIIDHGDGYMSLYAHNQSIFRETGDWVNAGETIATVGNSGGQTNASLYFEIRHNGRPTNPNRWCKRM
jgi:septal ring factor EnvC (AmiA/AmiB activator)